jgi:hypothetical protein
VNGLRFIAACWQADRGVNARLRSAQARQHFLADHAGDVAAPAGLRHAQATRDARTATLRALVRS